MGHEILNIKSIHHIAIICSNYERSKKFYNKLLGFKIIKETFRKERSSYKLDMEVGGKYQIELFSFPSPPPRVSRPEATGLRHVAFDVVNIEEAKRKLESQGVEVENIRIDELTGKKFCFFADPDGLPLELYET